MTDNKQTPNHPNSGETGKKAPGVSGQPSGPQEGPVAGDATNTRGENVSSAEAHGGNDKQDSPQGSNANPSDTRGADSSDKEFRNNQPNDSTSQTGDHTS